MAPVALLGVLLAACLGAAPVAVAADEGIGRGASTAADRRPHPGLWPADPGRLATLLAGDDFELRSFESAGGGVTGAARVVTYEKPLGTELTLKWKEAPPGDADHWNNSPRKELAAYRIQQWFLAPEDFVVPMTAVYCVPFAIYRTRFPDPEETIDGTRCVLGVASVWIDGVSVPERLFDADRFASDADYATHLARFNLFTYLVDHRDGRRGNFLVSDHGSHVFSVDNGIAFNPRIWNFFVRNWNRLRVPAVPREAVERLRAVRPADVAALAVVAQYAVDADGVLRSVPAEPAWDPRRGSRVRPGAIQLGLTRDELRALDARRLALLEGVDTGSIATF